MNNFITTSTGNQFMKSNIIDMSEDRKMNVLILQLQVLFQSRDFV